MKHKNDTPAHLRYQTQFSSTGEIDMSNKKPYRPKELKRRAKASAVKTKDGHFSCPMVPVRYHQPVRS